MHQEHNIPWNALTSNYHYVHLDRSRTPHHTGFALLNRPTQTKSLNYFTQSFISTIRDFATTERKKYSFPIGPPENGLLFSDELRDKYPEYLNTWNQKLDFWIKPRTYTGVNGPPMIWDGDLADVVKILIHENQMKPLLYLASHPRLPLRSLNHLGYYVQIGFHAIAEGALEAYIFWNFISSSGHLASGAYKTMERYKQLMSQLVARKSNDAQQIPHREFYGDSFDLNEPPEIDISKIHGYLSRLFRIIYCYDMLIAECQMNPGWEEAISFVLFYNFEIGARFRRF